MSTFKIDQCNYIIVTLMTYNLPSVCLDYRRTGRYLIQM